MRFLPVTQTTQYLKGFWPTPKVGRLTYDSTVRVLLNTRWKNENDETVAHAVAITRRESAGDPLAYLAYLRVPGRPDGTKWQQKVYENNRKWLRAIPTATDTGWNVINTMWELPSVLASRALYGLLPHRRIRFERTASGSRRADTGLFQLNSQYFPVLFDADANADFAYGIWKGWGQSFNAWATNDPDSLAPFLVEARASVSRVR